MLYKCGTESSSCKLTEKNSSYVFQVNVWIVSALGSAAVQSTIKDICTEGNPDNNLSYRESPDLITKMLLTQ